MIEVEVISSPDEEMLGKHLFYRNYLTMGQNIGDLLFLDKGIIDGQILIEVTEKDLLIHNAASDHYFINDKIANGSKKIKIGDVIGIGKTSVKICHAGHIQIKSKKEIIRKSLQLISQAEEHSLNPLTGLVAILEDDLKKIHE